MPIAQLNIPPGVVRGKTPLQTKGRYWDANLVRWRSGALIPVGGWQRITEAADLDSTCRTIFSWAVNNGTKYILFGCENKLYLLDGATYSDVTPAGYVAPDNSTGGGYGSWDYGQLLYGEDTGTVDPLDERPASPFYVPTFSWTIDNWSEEILAVASSDGRLLHFEAAEGAAHVVGVTPIASASRVSNVVTVTTNGHHGLSSGNTVNIAGNLESSFNGTWVIVSVPTETTFTFSDSGANATGTGGEVELPGVPTGNIGVIVTPERHAVLIGAGGYPRRVAWSSRENYNDWDFSSTTNTAGYLDLETATSLKMCAAVREGTLIWTEDEVWLMKFIGLPYVYSIERIGFGCGLIAPRAFATTAGRCIWMGRESFWMYDGGVVKPLLCDVGAYVFDDIDPDSGSLYTTGAESNLFSEAWFWYPSSGETTPNKYVAYNYAEQWWTIGEMSRTAACGAGTFPHPIATDGNNTAYYQEDGLTAAGDAILSDRYAETGAINMSNGSVLSSVRQFMADSEYGYDRTQLTVYSSFTPEGEETVSGPFLSRSDGYTDVRVTGRDFRLKISATQDQNWTIGEMRFDFMPRGSR